jgi:hypothetical protein
MIAVALFEKLAIEENSTFIKIVCMATRSSGSYELRYIYPIRDLIRGTSNLNLGYLLFQSQSRLFYHRFQCGWYCY